MTTYRVINRSRGVQLASEVDLADTLWTRLRGLLGRSAREFTVGRGLWLVPSQGIHTIGMSFPIDVVYLDGAGRVIKLYHGLMPFRVAAVKMNAKSVLEFPSGTLARSRTRVGDLLEIETNSPMSNE